MEDQKSKGISQIKKFILFAKKEKKVTLADFKKQLPESIFSSGKFFKIVEILERYGVEIETEQPEVSEKPTVRVQYDNQYMKEMSKHSLLSEEEEVLLVQLLEENELIILSEVVKTRFFFIYLMGVVRSKYKKKLKKRFGRKFNKLSLKKIVMRKIIHSMEKNDLMQLKREFKIPRSDLVKVAQKIVENTPNEEKIGRINKAMRHIDKLQEKLINSNLRLVLSIAKRYARKNSNLFDLIQEGNLGLIKAVEMFYYRRGIRFAAYAKWWIKQSIVKSLYENSHHIKIPLHFIDAIKKIEEFISNYIQEHKEYPALDEVMESTAFSKKKIVRILQIIAKPLSLDTPIFYKDSMIELKDTIKDGNYNGPYSDVFKTVVFNDIRKLLAGLSDKERKILIKRYGLEDGVQRTLDEVGYFFNLTRERIRQIEKKAFEKLKVPSKISMYRKLLEGDSI